MEFERLIAYAPRESRRLAEFLALGEDAVAIMGSVVEPKLRHHS
jgi:hypothetical protein